MQKELLWSSSFIFRKLVGTRDLGRCEVDLFLVFSSGILGETKQNKSAKVLIFTEFVLADCQKKQSKIL
jgi:hypothetical protein